MSEESEQSNLPATPYLRCRHCKGFYEASLERCAWCRYETPVLAADGRPRVYPDRATCRAIQISEYEQLPAEAREDPMGPPRDEPALLCGCLHCGQRTPFFEAVEMRWIANERMWACPCTTCGGRGFGIDIHPIENRWECADCRHHYRPADGRFVQSNCKCPKCGCTEASGWFEDEYDEDDFEDDEELENESEDESFPGALETDFAPWETPDVSEWKPGDDEKDDDPFDGGEEAMPDDIDFPRNIDDRDDGGGGKPFDEDDIPF